MLKGFRVALFKLHNLTISQVYKLNRNPHGVFVLARLHPVCKGNSSGIEKFRVIIINQFVMEFGDGKSPANNLIIISHVNYSAL